MSKKHHDDGCCCCGDMMYDNMLYPYENNMYMLPQNNNYDNCGNNACGWNIWTIILAIIILQCSGILCNNRAYVLLLLFWFCGSGAFGGSGGFGNCGCNNSYSAPVAPMSVPCCY